MDVEIEKVSGQVVEFSLNHRALIGDEWKEVIRYDTRHGRLHVHRFWRPQGNQVTYLEEPRCRPTDRSEKLQAARDDIIEGWERHRRLLEDAQR